MLTASLLTSSRPTLHWLLLLTALVLQTLARPSTRAVHRQLRLPVDELDKEFLQINDTCGCSQICFALTCHCYSVVEVAGGGLDCFISLDEVTKPDMVADNSATTICYSDYRSIGERFYRIARNMGLIEGRTQCTADGGHLAIVDTEEKIMELEAAMKQAGVDEVWIGLRLYSDSTTNWQYPSGPVLAEFVRTSKIPGWYWFTFALNATGPVIDNAQHFDNQLATACQRDY